MKAHVFVLLLLGSWLICHTIESVCGGSGADAVGPAVEPEKKDDEPKYDRLGATDETVPQSRVPKGPREFESVWFQAWLSSAEGGKTGRECTFQADVCLKDFKNRFRPEMRPKER